MILIVSSILLGGIGSLIGILLDLDLYAVLLGVVGFLCPSLYVLEKNLKK
jgi:hypothetical protein